MAKQFKVTQTAQLDDNEKWAVKNKEALFFYHSWLINDFDLVELAHSVLLDLEKYGLVSNYKETREHKDIESLLKQYDKLNDCDSKIRVNCPFTGKFEWVSTDELRESYADLIYRLSDHITEAYGLDDYFCGFVDGHWGLWHRSIDF